MSNDTAIARTTAMDSFPDTVGEARVNPKTGRPAGPLQGALLLAASCLAVLGAVLLSPVLPSMQKDYASTPGSTVLVPLVLTIPALFIAILAPFAGRIVDKLGRKRVLVTALFVYAVVGTAPLYINSLGGIIATRVGVGITEAFIMTCCTTLLADYFTGARRDKYLGMQALVTSISATVFFAIGGLLGSSGWRTPFWLYTVSLVLAVAMIFAIWATRSSVDGREIAVAKLPPMQWRPLLAPILVTIFGGIVFYTLIVELPFVMKTHGVTASAKVGAISAVASLATAIGAFLFRWVARRGTRVLLAGALGLAGVGLLIVALAPSVPVVLIGAIITCFGNGILLPTLVTWAISALDYEQRGRGTGAWTASIFFGEFACPLLVIGLKGAAGSLAPAIGAIGVLALLIAIGSTIALRPRRAPTFA
jgi:MFS family permease